MHISRVSVCGVNSGTEYIDAKKIISVESKYRILDLESCWDILEDIFVGRLFFTQQIISLANVFWLFKSISRQLVNHISLKLSQSILCLLFVLCIN